MPDGDIAHERLGKLYQKPYKSLCEGKATSDECARILLKQLKRDIQSKGDLPVVLAQSMAGRLIQVISADNKLGASDYASLSKEFDSLVRQSDGRSDIKELALRAGKIVLHDLKYGREVDIKNASIEILKQYIHEVYESEFKERIPLTPEHYAEVDEETLDKRIKEIQPNINEVIDRWARKAISKGSVSDLKLPPRQKISREVDMKEDSLSEHNHRNQEKIDLLLNSKNIEFITTEELKKYLSSASAYEVVLE